MKDKSNYNYFLVPELNDMDVRLELSRKFHENFGLSFIGTPSWNEIFENLFLHSQDNRIVVVFDEFQRFFDINKGVFSILQEFIDKYGKDSKMFLVVSGSSIGIMHKIFDHASPLYGRRSGQLLFQPFNFFALKDWFPDYSIDKLVEIYAIYGGTPKYLEDVENEDIMANIQRMLSKTSVLYSEPEILIKTEMSDSHSYFNILKHISQGVSRSSEIASCSDLKTTSIDYYLNVLINDMDILKKETPVTQNKKGKKSIYLMRDPFFRFWFKYIYPNYSELEIGNIARIIEKIDAELNTFVSQPFEDISQQFLIELNRSNKLPFVFEKIGRQWGKFKGEKGKNVYEIDIVALNEKTKDILFCECKWKNKKIDVSVLEDLHKKSVFVDWYNRERKEHFAVISKFGFTHAAEKFANQNGFLLFELDDFDKIT
ncbi:MAG: ATP-binding protein [Methanosarcinaceae archaeon]|nr:ATP-binding protein [Methanosarcinaceae archaeon]